MSAPPGDRDWGAGRPWGLWRAAFAAWRAGAFGPSSTPEKPRRPALGVGREGRTATGTLCKCQERCWHLDLWGPSASRYPPPHPSPSHRAELSGVGCRRAASGRVQRKPQARCPVCSPCTVPNSFIHSLINAACLMFPPPPQEPPKVKSGKAGKEGTDSIDPEVTSLPCLPSDFR